jgi:hypothetical protein
MKRYRLFDFTNDELNFANGPQTGSMTVGVDYEVDEGQVTFKASDVYAVRLALLFGNHLHDFQGETGEMVGQWLACSGNLQLLAARVQHAEERDPTRSSNAA